MKNQSKNAVLVTFPRPNERTSSLVHSKSKIAGMVTAALMAAPYALPSYGQDKEAGISALMEEIVVTARKREEGVQDIPIAVSAFSGKSLEARGITKIDGVADIIPNMTFSNINTNGGGGSNASVYIRGVGQTDFIPSADPGVGIYVDGVYLARSIGSVLDVIDVERIEILRGPQGTLFGRNTIGGAVSIHTVKPHDEFSAKVRVRMGTDSRQDIAGQINVPLTDTLFANASIASFQQDGFVKNRNTGDDSGDDDTIAFRGALRWQASDNLTFDFSADYSEDDEIGQAQVTSPDPDRAVFYAPGNSSFTHNFLYGLNSPLVEPAGIALGFREFNGCDATPANIQGTNASCANPSTVGLGKDTGTDPNYYEAEIWGVSANIEWVLSDTLTLKSITAYRDIDSEFARDGDSSPFLLGRNTDFFEQSQFSQEFQLLGTAFDGGLEWILGAYYFEEDGTNFNPVDFHQIDIESGGDFDHESLAGFAQATYHITEALHLTGGIRYTEDTKDFIVKGIVQTARPANAPIFVLPPGGRVTLIDNGTTTLESDDWTPMVNLAYDWTDDLMVYANYSEGYKGGGVQQRNAGVFGPKAPTYDPEFVESFEVGFKYTSDGGNFVLNAAAFFADYTDIQLETLAPDGVAPQLENAGEAEIGGLELEMRWAPADSWFVEAAVGWVDAEIVEVAADSTNSGGPAKGDTVPFVPEYNTSLSVIKIFDLGDAGTLTPRVDWSWRDDVLFSADNNPDNSQEAHSIVNVNVSWDSASDKYSVTLFLNNIADEETITFSEVSASSGAGFDLLGRGFEWYVAAEMRF
ncbi:MAG: iron complex outermembrane receptor protein [Halioglobus sp.]|jgi:iron complex outermembrane receptor protein